MNLQILLLAGAMTQSPNVATTMDLRLPSARLAEHNWFSAVLQGSAPGLNDGEDLEIRRQSISKVPDRNHEVQAVRTLSRIPGQKSGFFATMCLDLRAGEVRASRFSRCIYVQFVHHADWEAAQPVIEALNTKLFGTIVKSSAQSDYVGPGRLNR